MPTKQNKRKVKKSSNLLVGRIKQSYFIIFFILCILAAGAIGAYKLYFPKSTYVYAKLKVGQGYWWASTLKPNVWLVSSVKKGDVAYDILGKPSAVVLKKTYFRYYSSDQSDIYLTLMLKVEYNKKTGQYRFNRDSLSVGSSVEVQFPQSDITGTIIALSNKPFSDNRVVKTITLTKKFASPWEFDLIKVGDKFNDGDKNLFTIIDKQSSVPNGLLSVSNNYVNTGSQVLEPANYVTIKAKIMLSKVDGQWVFGEDQVVVPGRAMNISTDNFIFDNYVVVAIE